MPNEIVSPLDGNPPPDPDSGTTFAIKNPTSYFASLSTHTDPPTHDPSLAVVRVPAPLTSSLPTSKLDTELHNTAPQMDELDNESEAVNFSVTTILRDTANHNVPFPRPPPSNPTGDGFILRLNSPYPNVEPA